MYPRVRDKYVWLVCSITQFLVLINTSAVNICNGIMNGKKKEKSPGLTYFEYSNKQNVKTDQVKYKKRFRSLESSGIETTYNTHARCRVVKNRLYV